MSAPATACGSPATQSRHGAQNWSLGSTVGMQPSAACTVVANPAFRPATASSPAAWNGTESPKITTAGAAAGRGPDASGGAVTSGVRATTG
jgi:hypothetical protein